VIRFGRARLRLTRAQIMAGVRPPAVREVTDVCRRIHNRASVLCPVDTGNLRAHHGMRVNAGTVRGEVYNDADYAVMVHDGTRAHAIVARRGRVLRFVAGGRVVYARRVRHPGSRPQPWMTTAAAEVSAQIGARWTRR
jgi:hypothetical protein